MKKRLSSAVIVVWTVLLVLFLVSCQSAPEASFSANPAAGNAPLTVSFTNTSGEADRYDWNFGDGKSATTYSLTETSQHEYVKAGTYTVNLTASRGKTPLTGSAELTVTVNPGTVSTVNITPAAVELGIGETCEFSSVATDFFGNDVTGVNTEWQSEAGTITRGSFTAGTKAGTFPRGVSLVIEKDGVEVTGYVDVTIVPGPLDSVSVTSVELTAGQTHQMEFLARDSHGNTLEGLDASWSLAAVYQGTVTENGLLTASKRTGSVAGVVQVTVTDGDQTKTASGDISVVAGPLARVAIAPDPVKIGIGMMQPMVAAGADQFGNRIPDLEFTWETDPEAGSMVSDGVFTAGDEPDTYTGAITVTATRGTESATAAVDVTVVPDRVVFLSDMHDIGGDLEWFIMNADGSEPEQLTSNSNYVQTGACVSPDGRRFLYADADGMLITNIDGEWVSALISGQYVGEPAFSPDGSKIAFQSWEYDPAEICVMDVDGGNFLQLTNNSDYDDYPTWSPDGKRIAFISDRQNSSRGYNIFVMDADGSHQQALTGTNIFLDLAPKWSPVDENAILFFSDRSYAAFSLFILNPSTQSANEIFSEVNMYCMYPDWSPDGMKIIFEGINENDVTSDGIIEKSDICTISKTGANLTTLTSNGAVNLNPHFVPRLGGVTVTEASVIFAGTPTDIIELKPEVLTESFRDGVVRIETDLGSGSGFVVDSNGIIMTNNHVISDAGTITVHFSDGSDFNGTIVARDLIHDIAIIKVSKTGLHALQFKDIGNIKLGQQVMVLGYALGKENVSVTSGLVSSIEYDFGRNITWIQTDSAINPGNSGGPMLDLEGNVIGMVSAKLVGISVEGMGFAVSSNTIKTFLPRLLDGENILSFE